MFFARHSGEGRTEREERPNGRTRRGERSESSSTNTLREALNIKSAVSFGRLFHWIPGFAGMTARFASM
jgi:hypothetical protein